MANDMSMAKKIYKELQSLNKYSTKLYKSEVYAVLYVSHRTDDTYPSPLDITMTCNTIDAIWCVTIANAPQLPSAKIKEVINNECPWLALHTYICEYETIWNLTYMVFTIALNSDAYNHFIERVISIDHMLRILFDLPDNDG